MIDLIFAKNPYEIVSEIDYVAPYGSFASFTPIRTQIATYFLHSNVGFLYLLANLAANYKLLEG